MLRTIDMRDPFPAAADRWPGFHDHRHAVHHHRAPSGPVTHGGEQPRLLAVLGVSAGRSF